MKQEEMKNHDLWEKLLEAMPETAQDSIKDRCKELIDLDLEQVLYNF